MKKIVVTGCSHSAGTETILETGQDTTNQKINLFLQHRSQKGNISKVADIFKESGNWFESAEKENSWPAALERKMDCVVHNLATPGSNVANNYLLFAEFLKNCEDIPNVAIHQIPSNTRIAVKVNSKVGRINLTPGSGIEQIREMVIDKGTEFYEFVEDKKNLKDILYKYQKKVANPHWMNNYRDRFLLKIINLGKKYAIDQYFIFSKSSDICHNFTEKIIIDDLHSEIARYKLGKGGHAVDPEYANNVASIVKSKLLI